MKIALCLYGELRGFKYCFESIRHAFPSAEIDVFCSLWNRDFITTTFQSIEEVFKQSNVKLIKYKSFDDNSFDKYREFEKTVIHKGFEFYKELYKFKLKKFEYNHLPNWPLTRIELMAQSSFNMINDPDQYDYICKARYDIKYLENLEQHLTLLNSDYILVKKDSHLREWCNVEMIWDGFAAGQSNTMKTYYQFADWIPNYFTKGPKQNKSEQVDVLRDERVLAWWLEKIAKIGCKKITNCVALQIDHDIWYNESNQHNEKIKEKIQEKFKNNYNNWVYRLKTNHLDMYEKYKGHLIE